MFSANLYVNAILLLVITAFFSGCASQTKDQDFDDWDNDNDNFIDQEEFQDAFLSSDYINRWGLEEDTPLTYGDMYDVNFNLWDFDNNMVLTSQEWRNAIDIYFSDYDSVIYGDFKTWDLNGDEKVSKGEYMEAMLDTDLMEDWDIDQDETISQEEFARAVYQYWDTDGDGYIESTEYQEWEPVFSDV